MMVFFRGLKRSMGRDLGGLVDGVSFRNGKYIGEVRGCGFVIRGWLMG